MKWMQEVPANENLKALSEIQAQEAARDPKVREFRARYLENRLLPLSEVGGWLKAQREKEGGGFLVTIQLPPDVPLPHSDKELRQILHQYLKSLVLVRNEQETLSYPQKSAPPGFIVQIKQRGVLHKLKKLAQKLSEKYGWSESDAVGFVLCGVTPVPPLVKIQEVWTSDYGLLAKRITFTVYPFVTPTELAKFYRAVRAQTPYGRYVRVRGPKKLNQRTRALAVFFAVHPDLGWTELMRRWNEEHLEWAYRSVSNFRRDAMWAYRRVTGRSPPSRRQKKAQD